MSNFRRGWSKRGVRSVLKQKQGFANSYLFTAIAPLSGDNFHLLGFAEMSTQTEYLFLRELKKQHPHQPVVVVLDNAPCHRSKVLHQIAGLTLIYLPAYAPELNPPERFFEEIRRSTCNQIFDTLEAIETRLTEAVNAWTPERVRLLCGYPWIREALGG